MVKQKLQRGTFDRSKANSLSKLIECLVSAETQRNLFDRIADEDEDLEEIGLSLELAEIGICWWRDNSQLIDKFADAITLNLEMIAQSQEVSVETFMSSWSRDIWSNFIRETFDIIWSFGDENDYEYFFNYAVRQSLGYNTTWSSSQYECDNYHASWSFDVSTEEWVLLNEVFKAWWQRDDVFELYSWIFTETKDGRKALE